MKKLGLNFGAYRGETINIDDVLHDAVASARAHGWQCERIPAGNKPPLWIFIRAVASPRKCVYLSTGIHGDEPAGPLAVQQLLRENAWPKDVELWLCPCLNPTGFPLNRRENAEGVDLNRDYLHLQSDEIRAHTAWLKTAPRFDISLCLHEDWESHGFYLYELNPLNQPSHAERVIEEVSKICPIDHSAEIEGRPAHGGIIRPAADPRSRPQWPEAFFLLTHKTDVSFTFEAPSDFPIATRVDSLVTAVKTVLAAL